VARVVLLAANAGSSIQVRIAGDLAFADLRIPVKPKSCLSGIEDQRS